jgi:hypothetical protein
VTGEERNTHSVIEVATILHGTSTGSYGNVMRDELDAKAAWLKSRIEEGWNEPSTHYDHAVRWMARESLAAHQRASDVENGQPTRDWLVLAVKSSLQHFMLCWWREKSQGYTYNFDEAGRYSFKEAVDCTRGSRGEHVIVALADIPTDRVIRIVHDGALRRLQKLAIDRGDPT